MSAGYAARLKTGVSYGPCGLPELSCSARELEWKTTAIAKAIKEAEHLVAFTGAGISTACGIPDFRGPNGIWTLERKRKRVETAKTKKETKKIAKDSSSTPATSEAKDHQTLNVEVDEKSATTTKTTNQQIKEEGSASTTTTTTTTTTEVKSEEKKETEASDNTFELAVPSLTHMALLGLVNSGIVKFVVSQNIDGIHRRSGLTKAFLSELHGDAFLEICDKCGVDYFRDFDVGGVGCKETERSCTICNGKLRDFVLDWQDPLPEPEFNAAENHCRSADVVLCLGTSLRIQPANQLPLMCRTVDQTQMGKKSNLIICNLQRTALDEEADLVIHTRCDTLMSRVMKILDIPIPIYSMKQQYAIGAQRSPSGDWLIYVRPSSVPLEELLQENKLKDKELVAHRYIASVQFSIDQDAETLSALPFVLSSSSKSNLNQRIANSPSAQTSTVDIEIRFKTPPCTIPFYRTQITLSYDHNPDGGDSTTLLENIREIEVLRLDYNSNNP